MTAVLAAGCGSVHRPSAPAELRRAGDGIPRSLLAGARPIGRGAGFHPPARGPVLGACRPSLGSRTATHVELFARNRVLLIAAGVGARPPLRMSDARVVAAGCFGALVTLDPTGTVYVRAGSALTLGDLFRSWGEPLMSTRIASFGGSRVRIYIDGHRSPRPPREVALTPGAEIVLEVGPYVPPHRSFTFPPPPRLPQGAARRRDP
jgi:hypothetical protein